MWRSAATLAPAFSMIGALVYHTTPTHCEDSAVEPAVAVHTPPAPVWLRREFPNSAAPTNQASVQHLVQRTIDLYDCKYTKKHMDIYEEDAVFEDVFMRLSGVPPIRTAFKAMVDLLTPYRIAAHIDLHSYDPQECATSSGAPQVAQTAAFSAGISTTPAVGSNSTKPAPAAVTATAMAADDAAADKKQLPEGAIVISPILHATDRAIVLRMQYTYTTLWGSVKLPFHSIVRLYIREEHADEDEAAPRAEHLRYKIVRHEDLLYGHDLLSWRNGGPAGALFNLLRGANGALFYVIYSFFSS